MPLPLPAIRAGLGRLVADDTRDLSLRQLCLLIDCAQLGPQTVRGMAARLGVSRPAITRAADRLAQHGLLVRKDDRQDRRSVFLVCTLRGADLLNAMAGGQVVPTVRGIAA